MDLCPWNRIRLPKSWGGRGAENWFREESALALACGSADI